MLLTHKLASEGRLRVLPTPYLLTYYLLTCYLTLVAHHYRIYTVPYGTAAYLLRALLPSLHLRTRMPTRPSRPSPHPPSSDPSRLHGVDRGELVDDGGVGERGGVAELVGLLARDLAQHAPHHLTRARLGQP